MMIKHTLFLVLLLTAGISNADSPPPIPNTFSGTVKFSNSSGWFDAPAGTLIEAYIDSTAKGHTTAGIAGAYIIDVYGTNDDDNKTITFIVNGTIAEENAVFNTSSPPPRILDLVVSEPSDTQPPTSLSILINNGVTFTNSTSVMLIISAVNATEMTFSNDSILWSPWELFATTKPWILTDGDGIKTVYFKARNGTAEAAPVNDTIILDTTKPTVTNLTLSTYRPIMGEPVNISVNVSDAYLNASSVFVSVNPPKGIHTVTYQMNGSNGNYYYNYKDTQYYGKYHVTIIASDLAGNINRKEKITWFVTVMPPYINKSVNTTANNTTAIDARNLTDTTLELVTFNDTVGGAVNITMSSDIPPQINQSFTLVPFGKYIEINASENIKNKTNLAWIRLKIFYTKAELIESNLDESSLRISWYNESSSPPHWETLAKGYPEWVNDAGLGTSDTSGYKGYVWVNISHLSTFGLFGSYLSTQQYNPPGGGSSSGGGGGGGGTSGENFSNIELREKYEETIYKDKPTSYRFKNASNPIMFVNITGNINAGLITTMAEVLKGTSTLVKEDAPGDVYKNINLWVGTSGFATAKNINEATIMFRVDNSWIDNKALARNEIKLVKWESGKWIILETSEKTRDSDYTFFEVKTTSFSCFAITGIRAAPSAAKPTVTQSVPTPVTTAAQGEAPRTNLFLIIGVIILVVIGVGLYLWRRK